MRDHVDALDSFVERAVLCDIFDCDKLESLAVRREQVFEEYAPRQRADGAAHGVPGFEVFLHDVSGEIAVRARDEDFSRRRDGNHLEERD